MGEAELERKGRAIGGVEFEGKGSFCLGKTQGLIDGHCWIKSYQQHLEFADLSLVRHPG